MRRSPQDYFEVALQVLEESGFPALTASALCDRMGITRGSFYHHFENFDAFVDGLMGHWEQHYSRDLITRSEAVGNLAEQLQLQAELAMSLPHGAEVALRAWGTIDPRVADPLRRVDDLRRDAVTAAIHSHGLPAGIAATYADFFLSALIGAQMTGTTREQMLAMHAGLGELLIETVGNQLAANHGAAPPRRASRR